MSKIYLSDVDVLIDVANNDPISVVRQEAVSQISDVDVLVDFVLHSPLYEVRAEAINNITDENILADIFTAACDGEVRKSALEKISDADTLRELILENFGYFSVDSYSQFKRSYDKMIYEAMGTDIYEHILDRFNDESVLLELLEEKLFSNFRALIVRRLTSADALRNLAENDLNYYVRLEATRNPNLCDESAFCEIIRSDCNDWVRLEALKRTDDRDVLEDMVNDPNPLIRLYASERLGVDFTIKENDFSFDDVDLSSIDAIDDEKMLYSVITNVSLPSIRRHAFDRIRDEQILADIACHDRQFTNMALDRIADRDVLLNIALYCTDQSVKRKAIKKIDDEKILFETVQANPYNDISAYALDRIRDERLLEIITFNNSNPYIRKSAVNMIQNDDIIVRLGEIESEEPVCTAIIRKTNDKKLLEYIGLSNPAKTVRRYVESVCDDEDLLYRFALKEYESDNRREIISKMTNEEYIFNLFKRETVNRVFDADFKISDNSMFISLVKSSLTYSTKTYGLKNIADKSVLRDYIYSSPFSSRNPDDASVWEGASIFSYDVSLCLTVLSRLNDIDMIVDFLRENDVGMCGELYNILSNVTRMSSRYKIYLNCKLGDARGFLKHRIMREYSRNYESDEKCAVASLYALFG